MGSPVLDLKCVCHCGRRFVSHQTLMVHIDSGCALRGNSVDNCLLDFYCRYCGIHFVCLKDRDVHELDSHVNSDVLQVGVERYAQGVRLLLSFFSPSDKVKNIVELLRLIRQHLDGIPVSDVKYAYPTVLGDLKVLEAAGQVILISSPYALEDMVYPSDPPLYRPTTESAQSSKPKQRKNKKRA